MKNIIYKIVVDTWRLAVKYNFQRMDDSTWEEFVEYGQKLVRKSRAEGRAAEKLCRDLFGAFQSFYKSLNDADGGGCDGKRNCDRLGIQKPER